MCINEVDESSGACHVMKRVGWRSVCGNPEKDVVMHVCSGVQRSKRKKMVEKRKGKESCVEICRVWESMRKELSSSVRATLTPLKASP